jgi:hypothetical protein
VLLTLKLQHDKTCTHSYQNADLHGKDIDRFVEGVNGEGWTTGVNHANGDSAPYHYNHYTGELVFESKEKLDKKGRPLAQNRDRDTEPVTEGIQKASNGEQEFETKQSIKAIRAPIGRVWKKGIDLRTGEVYWENQANGASVCTKPCLVSCAHGPVRVLVLTHFP